MNSVINHGGTLIGDNTDGKGFFSRSPMSIRYVA